MAAPSRVVEEVGATAQSSGRMKLTIADGLERDEMRVATHLNCPGGEILPVGPFIFRPRAPRPQPLVLALTATCESPPLSKAVAAAPLEKKVWGRSWPFSPSPLRFSRTSSTVVPFSRRFGVSLRKRRNRGIIGVLFSCQAQAA